MDIIDTVQVMERLDRITKQILGGNRTDILEEVTTYREELERHVVMTEKRMIEEMENNIA